MAVILGGVILLVGYLCVSVQSVDGETVVVNSLAPVVGKVGKWESNPLEALGLMPIFGLLDEKASLLPVQITCVFLISAILFGLGMLVMGTPPQMFVPGFASVFLLTVVAYLLANQLAIKNLGLGYPLWALLIGMLISNTIGTPAFIKPAVKTEFYIKTGLVLLGAKVLLDQLLVLGVPGIFVAWVVTPIVLIGTYLFGQHILKIESKTLNITISADMSVCGVSAAIATAAACRAKKEELSLAVGLSLIFTVFMMFLMPVVVKGIGMSEVLGGAWMGGTIDATGAVAAAGESLGNDAELIAITVKMIQNILIGVTAFCVAVYWTTVVEAETNQDKPHLREIWVRFPKFIIGFVAASLFFTVINRYTPNGSLLVKSMIKGTSDVFRGWFFCFAFVSIGLETDFRSYSQYLKGGKPLVLYVCGQAFNLLLTLFMAWLMFEVIFGEQIQSVLDAIPN